jgi:hypothetical protein
MKHQLKTVSMLNKRSWQLHEMRSHVKKTSIKALIFLHHCEFLNKINRYNPINVHVNSTMNENWMTNNNENSIRAQCLSLYIYDRLETSVSVCDNHLLVLDHMIDRWSWYWLVTFSFGILLEIVTDRTLNVLRFWLLSTHVLYGISCLFCLFSSCPCLTFNFSSSTINTSFSCDYYRKTTHHQSNWRVRQQCATFIWITNEINHRLMKQTLDKYWAYDSYMTWNVEHNSNYSMLQECVNRMRNVHVSD